MSHDLTNKVSSCPKRLHGANKLHRLRDAPAQGQVRISTSVHPLCAQPRKKDARKQPYEREKAFSRARDIKMHNIETGMRNWTRINKRKTMKYARRWKR